MGKISDALDKADRAKSEKETEPPSKPISDSEGDTKTSAALKYSPKTEKREKSVVESTVSSKETISPKSPTVDPVENNIQDLRQATAGLWDHRLFEAVNEDYYIPEVFRTLRSRILLPGNDRKAPKTIMVTSVAPKEGKSFVTANLGVSLAQGMDQYSLLVNCDFRRPSLSALFGMETNLGLVDYLQGDIELEDIILKTAVGKLSILPSGKCPSNPAELLGSARMRSLIGELAQRYEDRFVIFDTPPFDFAAETAVLAKMVDAIVLVVREGGAPKYHVKKLIDKMGKERLLGVVFNGHTTNIVDRTLMKDYSSYGPYAYE